MQIGPNTKLDESVNKSSAVARGVYAAVLTPFKNDLSPDSDKFVDYCHGLLADGCDGLAPFGTTGEGASLSVDQKIELINAARSGGLPMNRIIAGTGVSALADAVKIATLCASYECEGVLCLPPFFYKNPAEDGLFAFYSELIEKVGDSRLKVFLYHFPGMSAVPITVSLVERLLTRYPDTVVGLKDSSGDWTNTLSMIEAFPGFKVFSGSEHFLLDNLRAGGAGCISATTNLTAREAAAVYKAWLDEEGSVEDLQKIASGKRLTLQNYPLIPMLKTIVAQRQDDASWLNMLPPMVALEGGLDEDLQRFLG